MKCPKYKEEKEMSLLEFNIIVWLTWIGTQYLLNLL